MTSTKTKVKNQPAQEPIEKLKTLARDNFANVQKVTKKVADDLVEKTLATINQKQKSKKSCHLK